MMSALVSDPNPEEMLIFKNDFRLLNGSPIRIFMQNFNLFGFKRNDCTMHNTHSFFVKQKKKGYKNRC